MQHPFISDREITKNICIFLHISKNKKEQHDYAKNVEWDPVEQQAVELWKSILYSINTKD